MKGKLNVKLSGREKEYYDQALRELRAGRANEAITSFNNCKTIMRGSFMALDEGLVKAYTELGKEAYLKTQNSAWFVVASDAAIKMCRDYGKESYVPWLRRAKVLEAGKLHKQSLHALEKVLSHPAYAKADATIHKSVLDLQKTMRFRAKEQELRKEAAEELEQLAKDLKAELFYKSTTNFVKQLPPDALLCIADAGLAMEQGFAIRMAGVCREWRRVVTGRAGLWDTLVLGQHKPVQKARLWFERSQGRLRELRFTPWFPSNKLSEVRSTLDPALANIGRLTLEDCGDLTAWDYKWSGRFSGLHSLSIRRSDHEGGVHLIEDPMIIRSRCTLREYLLRGCIVCLPDMQFDLGPAGTVPAPPPRLYEVGTLELLDCQILAPPERLEMYLLRLRKLRELQFQRLRFIGPQEPPQLSDDGEHHIDHLETYQIAQGDGPLLRCRMPVLATFDCYGSSHQGVTLLPYVSSRIQPFSTSLTSLDLGRILLNIAELIPLLERLPTLQFLGVSQSGLDDKFLDQLSTAHNGGPMILPNLQAISLAGNEITTLAVRDFVMKRVPLSEWVAAAPPAPPAPPKPTGGAFRPAKVAKAGGGMFKPTSTSALARTPSGGSSGLIPGRPSRPTPAVQATPSMLPTPTPASQSLSQPAQISPSAVSPTNANNPAVAPSTNQHLPELKVARIQWINLDACQLVDPSLKDHLVKFVRFVSIAPGALNEDRVRAKGEWGWKGDWKETCTHATKCRLVPALHKREEWEVRHYCIPDAAAEAMKIPSFSQRVKSV